jgi:hypothetical protein
MGFYWLATKARTGEIITDLPLLAVDKVKCSVGRYETTSATLPIATKYATPEWERAVRANAVHLILLQDNPDDPAHGIPLVGYRITSDARTEGDTVPLDLATIDSYLDSRYVGDETFTAAGQNSIVTSLVNEYVKDGGSGKNGIPIRVQQTTAGVGKLRTKTYEDADDKTLYSVLQELAGIIDGPEWYIGWEWQTNPERLTPVLYVGDRVGRPIPDGYGPAATFEMPGPVTSFKLGRDYKQGRGANDVMATSSGGDGPRPQSQHLAFDDPDQPTVEFRFTPSTSISNISTLNDHAATALAAIKSGSVSLEMSAVAANAPKLGIDWGLGDDVGFVIGGLDPQGRETVPSVRGGIQGTARVAGWELTLGDTPIITPILVSVTGAFV